MTSYSTVTDDALGADDAVGLLARLAARDVSASELTAAAIDRARASEVLGAIAVDRFDAARADADAHQGGPFAGIPAAIKDMVDVEGLPTRFGSEAFPTATPAKQHDPLVQQMVDLGLTPMVKTTMPEFGFTPSTEFPHGPPTRNPWNLDRTAGGSSGGSAALVAAGVVPIAHAADGGGSTRIPAACCGLVGLKPTAGRLIASKNTSHQVVAVTVDGVLTRSVRDTAYFYAQAEHHFLNPKLPPMGMVDRPLQRPLRIAAVDRSPRPGSIDASVRSVFDSTVELLESLGHSVTAVEPPIEATFADDFSTLWHFFGAATLRGGKRIWGPAFDRDGVSDFVEGLGGAFHNKWARMPGVVRRLRRSRHVFADRLQMYDVVVMPTVAQVSPQLGHLGMDLPYDVLFPRVGEWAQFTPLANGTGTPAISLPLGCDDATNLPVGMMFGAHYGQDRTLLELALQLEEAQPWAQFPTASTATE